MTTEFFYDAIYKLEKKNHENPNFRVIENFYETIINEAESDDKKLYCYGLVSKKYDNKLLENYTGIIEGCRLYAKDKKYENDIIYIKDDDEFILTIILGFYNNIFKYDYSDGDKLLKRLAKLFDTNKYTLFFLIFFILFDNITFENGEYFNE